MSEWNSAGAYGNLNIEELQNSIGIPQFSGSAGTDWYLVFNGLIIQGGLITVTAGTAAFPLVTAFSQQVLGVFLQTDLAGAVPAVSATTLSTFDVTYAGADNNCYWWAIGV